MFTWNKRHLTGLGLAVAFAVALPAQAVDLGLGRAATPAELQAWDIDVRPDFKGLPKGSGTVEQGEDLWESTCAACHGSFGESNLVFTPLIGGTTADDIETGRVASLTSPTQSVRTTIMKAATVSTLWDYIRRAMPWDNPRSLATDDVYAALAYLLSLAEIVDDDFTLSDENIAEVQERMPNRNNLFFYEGLWKVDGAPDTHNVACMTDCGEDVEISSALPDYARDANGQLAAQMRIVGPVRGVDSLAPALTGSVTDNAAQVRATARETLAATHETARASDTSADGTAMMATIEAAGCLACHARDTRVLGPSFQEVASRYEGEAAHDRLVAKVRNGGSGVWGPIPMPPHPDLDEGDLARMIDWILAGAR